MICKIPHSLLRSNFFKTLNFYFTFLLLLIFNNALIGKSDVKKSVNSFQAENIVVDGILDEKAWSKGEWYTGFNLVSMGTQKASVQTRFKICHDDNYIYFGIISEEPVTSAIKVKNVERDGKAWEGNSIEIMIDPYPDVDEYFHYAINSLGNIYDAQVLSNGVREVDKWNGNIKLATKLNKNSWVLELRIPFNGMLYDPEAPGKWRFNIVRNRKSKQKEISSFVPLSGSFHQPNLFAELDLQGANMERFLWKIEPPFDIQTIKTKDGLRQSCSLKVKNMTGKFRFIDMELASLHSSRKPSETVRISGGTDSGQNSTYCFENISVTNGSGELQLKLYDRNRKDVPLAVRSFVNDVDYTPINIDITQPFYRNNIYATEKLKSIIADIKLSISGEEATDASLIVELKHKNDKSTVAGKRIKISADTLSKEKFHVELPVKNLDVGDYIFEVTVTGKGQSEPIASASKEIRKLPAVPEEWRIREDGIVLYNGKPFVAFGFFGVNPEWFDLLKAEGFNTIVTWSAPYKNDKNFIKYLDKVHKSGLKVIFYPYTREVQLKHPAIDSPLSKKEAEAIRKRIRALRHHPAILGYFIFDEPACWPLLPYRGKQVYDICADEDPYHPCIMTIQKPSAAFVYRDTTDILMPDPYPGFIWRKGPARAMSLIQKSLQTVIQAGRGRKAIWMTPQTFNWQEFGRANQREPNFIELRNMIWQGIISGSTGIVAFKASLWFPEIKIGMNFLAREVRDLKNVIIAPECPASTVVLKTDDPDICYSSRYTGKNLNILTSSAGSSSRKVRFRINTKEKISKLFVVSEGRTVSVENGIFTDLFKPYDVNIYTTDESLSKRPLTSLVQAELDRLRQPKPGNIFHESFGTEAAVSHPAQICLGMHTVTHAVIDGSTSCKLRRIGWVGDCSKPLPQWLQITAKTPQTIGRVVIYSYNVRKCELQILQNGQWITKSTLKLEDDKANEIKIVPPVKISSIRIKVSAYGNKLKYFQIYEVEGYEK